jgi:hypothetical protein
MTRRRRSPAQELDVIAGTQGGGGGVKCEAEVVCGTTEDADGDAGATCGTGMDVRAMRGTIVDVGAARGMGKDVEAMCVVGWGTGAVCGMTTVSEVPAPEEG